MKPEMKRALRAAMEAPPPVRKQDFLRKLPRASVSQTDLVLLQASYIRKRIWMLAAAVLGTVLIGTGPLKRDVLWMLGGLMPFIAMAAVTENVRSDVFGMSELEMTCRFSLKSVVLARMVLVGGVHLVLLCLLALAASPGELDGFWKNGVYMLVPYLLTAGLGLFLARRIRGREALYACLGAAVLVSGLDLLLKTAAAALFEPSAFPWWLAALAAVFLFAVLECYKTIKQTEELAWN